MKDELIAIFGFVFGTDSYGYMRLFVKSSTQKDDYEEKFFEYPHEVEAAISFISRNKYDKNVYFCPHLFSFPVAKKENAKPVMALWSDIDLLPYEKLLVEPSLVLQTSNNKQQAIWVLSDYLHPSDAETINKRIAYHHADEGADKSGWDLTQLLRVPYTYNFKYGAGHDIKVVLSRSKNRYDGHQFDVYPPVDDEVDDASEGLEFPGDVSDMSPGEILNTYKSYLSPRAMHLYTTEPTDDWSRALWEFELCLFESGMKPVEAYAVTLNAACNKYERDDRKDRDLWKDIVRAYKHVRRSHDAPVTIFKTTKYSDLVSEDESKWIDENPDISQEYIEWASNLSDAASQYHQAGAFTILSTLLTGAVRLPTSFGTILPNLWFMILADTTLTRKSTAMDIAMDLLQEVDSEAILATDGSIEGLLSSLSTRPGRPSIFWRDEFTGLMEMVSKRDYYSGMLETFTKLYDGKFMRRQLKKETIEVREPILIMLTGGIKSKMVEQLEHSHVTSGFIPRFVFITAEADVTKIKPLGPPTDQIDKGREKLLLKFYNMHKHYWEDQDHDGIKLPASWNAKLTADAWDKYNYLDYMMLQDAMQSKNQDVMTPVFDRLSKSGLKVAVLLAAASKLDDQVVVEEEHIVRGFNYVQDWREHTLYVIENLGTTGSERRLQEIVNYINVNPGVPRSDIMRRFRMTAREADGAMATLDQRGLIHRQGTGKGESYRPRSGEE